MLGGEKEGRERDREREQFAATFNSPRYITILHTTLTILIRPASMTQLTHQVVLYPFVSPFPERLAGLQGNLVLKWNNVSSLTGGRGGTNA